MIMANDKGIPKDVTAIAEEAAEQTMEKVYGAMGNYFSWLRQMASASPWDNTDLNKKLLKYAEQNIGAALTFAQKLSKAKNLSDVVTIQSEFVAMQFNSYNEQARELGDVYGKSVMSAMKTPFGTPTQSK
jgi:hypothetical protein